MNMNIYEDITNLVITKLESGTVPWEKGWAEAGQPTNYVSKKTYHGINTLLLSMQGYTSKYWLTFNQVVSLKGQVKAGSKSTPIVYFDFIESKTEKYTDRNGIEKAKVIPMIKKYSVFNVAQTTLKIAEEVKTDKKLNPIMEAEQLIHAYSTSLPIYEKEQRAYYHPLADYINMPKMHTFINSEYYYSVLFHELTHSTGHAKRLNREEVTKTASFGSHLYSKEELVAEMGACFLNSFAGITAQTIDNSTAYIQSWIKALKNDKRLLVTAGTQAQKAVEYITSYQGK